ncbi:hypothetical protein [Caulobacter endophyticus]|uniref:Polyketide cyclase / dehydrase and lipid transport n=1 Tax=Caulobacter endophyticus TaxID=2172652 RepID=A0A2T9K885_9CAUL|nr:hypothetical protein [Caulobacter endophyticus]PVM92021.1 hypothetical protein DDF67_05905 [Caulobacter endophyticus]
MARFNFEGLFGGARYMLVSFVVLLGQHLILLALVWWSREPTVPPLWIWINPGRELVFGAFMGRESLAAATLPVGVVVTLAADALLIGLAFRRARYVRGPSWIPILTITPVLQLLVITWLAAAPARRGPLEDRPSRAARTVAFGLLAGVGLTLLVVAFSVLLLGTYGYTLFLAAPFVIALVIGYIANRPEQASRLRTSGLVSSAFLLGGLALIGFAFEGLICLVMASPLIALMGWIGALTGRSLAGMGRPGRGTTLASVAVLPILLAGEALAPPRDDFESVESIEIAAPPAAVWDSVVHMGPIPGAPAAPFRWGLAYPMRGEIQGEGVGAIRRGVFSTGVAYERVTAWEPGRRLDFIVLSDPPSLKELSPYEQVNAPHMNGYFRTRDARFSITPLPGGRSRLTLATHHDLDLAPAAYWTPMAQWAVHANKQRVLHHFRRQAEAGREDVGATPATSIPE